MMVDHEAQAKVIYHVLIWWSCFFAPAMALRSPYLLVFRSIESLVVVQLLLTKPDTSGWRPKISGTLLFRNLATFTCRSIKDSFALKRSPFLNFNHHHNSPDN